MLAIEDTDSLIGETLKGSYRIVDRIGAGAMGFVYRAVQLAVGREVAVKILNTSDLPPSAMEEAAERFRREARALSLLTHPNIVRLIDFGQTRDGMWFLVLEMLVGQPLSEIIRTQAPLDHVRVARIGRQIARALTEAHSSGIVHRDLKPDNIFLCTYDGDPDFVRVMDFGIARVVDDRAFGGESVTQRHTVLGSPNYMAPEQSDAATVTVSADMYSLGIVLYECLTGAPPFRGDSFMEIAVQHARDPVPPLEHDGMSTEELTAWHRLMDQLLDKDPRERLHSASDAADTLAAIEQLAKQGQSPEPASLPASAWNEPAPAPTQQKTGLMVIAALAFIGIGAALASLLGGSEGSAAPMPSPQVQAKPLSGEADTRTPVADAGATVSAATVKAPSAPSALAGQADAGSKASSDASAPPDAGPSSDKADVVAAPDMTLPEPDAAATPETSPAKPPGAAATSAKTVKKTTKKVKKTTKKVKKKVTKKKKKKKKKKGLGIEFRRD